VAMNGQVVATSSRFHPGDFNLDNDRPLRIGHGAYDAFTGQLADLRLYRRALTAGELLTLSQS